MISLSCTYQFPSGGHQLNANLETKSSVLGIVGPSGSGKSTLLRLIAGLNRAESCRCTIGEQVLNAPGHVVPVQKRNISFIQQHSGLFPHLNVEGNLRFNGVRLDESLIDRVDIRPLLKRSIQELSHGEAKRVELVRALQQDSQIYLLDEFFYGLDKAMRQVLYGLIRELVLEPGKHLIFTTHQEESLVALAEEVAIINALEVKGTLPIDKALPL